jgi:serine/threonine protein kinase
MYMSLEQLSGDRNIDARTDVYAFGVMLYEAIAGHVPYTASTLSELAIKVLTTEPVPLKVLRPDVPTSLARVVDWAIAKRREDRIHSAMALLQELSAFAREASFRGEMTNGADTYDTVIANASRLNGDKLLRISSSGTLSLANNSGGYANKPDRAAVAGIVYWSPGGVRKGAVGCAKIFVDGKTANDTDQDQLYNAASGLPTTLDKQSQTLKAGRYFIANMTVGQHSIRASLDNGTTFLGTAPTTFLVPFPRSEASSTTKAVLVQASIDIDVPTNPTPATCVDPA